MLKQKNKNLKYVSVGEKNHTISHLLTPPEPLLYYYYHYTFVIAHILQLQHCRALYNYMYNEMWTGWSSSWCFQYFFSCFCQVCRCPQFWWSLDGVWRWSHQTGGWTLAYTVATLPGHNYPNLLQLSSRTGVRTGLNMVIFILTNCHGNYLPHFIIVNHKP